MATSWFRFWQQSGRLAPRPTRRPSPRRCHPVLECLEARTVLNTYTVTNINDAGPGSLRQAIVDANLHSGPDYIVFNIPGSGTHIIYPTSPLPGLMDPVTIEGDSQPGYNGTPLIVIDGVLAGQANGLVLNVSGCIVRGLWVSSFAGNGIYISSSSNWIYRDVIGYNNGAGVFMDGLAHANLLQGDSIGTNPGGTDTLPNQGGGVVLYDGPYDNFIGTALGPFTGNSIAGNTTGGLTAGVYIFYSGHNSVQGNWIGVGGASGTVALGNDVGVWLGGGAYDNTIGGVAAGSGNVISGNHQQGIVLAGDSGDGGNVVEGNLIGTDPTGSAAVPNGTFGIWLSDGANGNLIGGTSAGARNIISGNNDAGVVLQGGTNNNVIHGNYIGTDPSGAAPLGNGIAGVRLVAGAHNNSLLNNLVSSNQGPGLWLSDSGTAGNTILNNAIGGNAGVGVTIVNSSSNNHVWGNSIGANGGSGVQVGDGVNDVGAITNDIRFNNIAFNGGLGIDLAGDGVTPNHDVFTPGPNNFQNYPVLAGATSDGMGNTTVTGTLQSPLANTPFALDFFVDPSLDPSGFGQGVQYVFTLTGLTTDDNGMAAFAATFPSGTPGQFVTATATDPGGNTSEFSAGVMITAAGTASGTPGRGGALALGALETSRWTPPTGELSSAYAVPQSLSAPAGKAFANDLPEAPAVDRFFDGASGEAQPALRHQVAARLPQEDLALLNEEVWAPDGWSKGWSAGRNIPA